MRTRVHILLVILAASALGGCETLDQEKLTEGSTGCKAGMAQIAVHDGFLQRLCGCTESGNTVIAPGTELKCTVASGTVIFFHFQTTHLRHEIVPVGTPALPASAPFNPDHPIRTAAVKLVDSGTYDFKDQFNGDLLGSIIVP